MAEWGRKEYSKAWPSRTPVWTVTAFLLTPLFLAGLLTWQYERSWTAAERLYLSDYLKSGARGKAWGSGTDLSAITSLEVCNRVVARGRIEPPRVTKIAFGEKHQTPGQHRRAPFSVHQKHI
jgi:hypothetical protein